MKKIAFSLAALLTASSTWLLTNKGNSNTSTTYQTSLCLSEFHQDTAPELMNPKLDKKTYPFCYDGFTLIYSGVSKTPLWVAEKLSPQRLASKVKREDNFHEEQRLPLAARSLLTDYRSSSYDRGHMAPSGDMATRSSQNDSFALTNIIPQHPDNNQNTWREIEEATRTMVNRYHVDAFVVTGPSYLQSTVKYIKTDRNVLVPSHVYKAIYIPELNLASAYFSNNDASRTAKTISICELESMIGINVFPQLDEQTKRMTFKLPLKASQVKQGQIPKLIGVDQKSKCSAIPSHEQMQLTRHKFSIGNDYSQNQSIDLSQVTKQMPDVSSLPNKESFNINQLLVLIVQWLKENDQRNEH